MQVQECLQAAVEVFPDVLFREAADPYPEAAYRVPDNFRGDDSGGVLDIVLGNDVLGNDILGNDVLADAVVDVPVDVLVDTLGVVPGYVGAWVFQDDSKTARRIFLVGHS